MVTQAQYGGSEARIKGSSMEDLVCSLSHFFTLKRKKTLYRYNRLKHLPDSVMSLVLQCPLSSDIWASAIRIFTKPIETVGEEKIYTCINTHIGRWDTRLFCYCSSPLSSGHLFLYVQAAATFCLPCSLLGLGFRHLWQ